MPPFFWLFVVALVVLLLVVFAFVLKASLDGDTIAQLELDNRRLRNPGLVVTRVELSTRKAFSFDLDGPPTRIERRTRTPDGVQHQVLWDAGDLEDLAGERGER